MQKHTLKDWVIATRPWSFPASAMPVLVSLAYLFWTGVYVDGWLGLWALVNIVIFHAAGNTWSDYFDFRKGVDSLDGDAMKPLCSGKFTPKEVWRLSVGLTLVGVVAGVGLVCLTGLPLLWIGMVGALLTLLYPYLKFHALGDVDILLTYGLLPTVGTSFIATGRIDWNVLLIALPVGLLVDGILHINNTRDSLSDRQAGIKTFAMLIGSRASAALYVFEALFPFVWIVGCAAVGVLPWWGLTSLLALPVAVGCAKSAWKSVSEGAAPIATLDVRTSQLLLLFSLLLTAGLVVAALL